MSRPALLLPDEPISIRLMNSLWADRSGLQDDLETRHDLAGWLSGSGLAEVAAGDIDDAEVAAARRLRTALRSVAAWLTSDARPVAQDAVDLDDALAELAQAVRWSRATPLLERHDEQLVVTSRASGSPALTALTTVADDAVRLFGGQDVQLLRACGGPGCVLYFLRRHPRRTWCSPTCGNRARVARHYRRQRSAVG